MTEASPPAPEWGVTTGDVGPHRAEEDGRMFPCERCGADLRFHIGQQRLKCPYCGFEKKLEVEEDAEVAEQDFEDALEQLAAKRREDAPRTATEQSEVSCKSCGATVVFTGPLTSSECAYCGSPIQRENVHRAEDRIPVDGVLPFQVSRERARDNLGKWVSSRWFAPNEFVRRGVKGKFSGVYIPYWTYDTMTANRYSGMRGEYYWVTVGSGKNRRTERRTRWYPASGSFQRFFDDVLVCAARALPSKRVLALEPWPLPKCIPFTEDALAGYLAETYEVPLDRGFKLARDRIDQAIRSEVRRRIGGDTQRIHQIQTKCDAITYKHLLLPLWLLTYRYRDKPYRVLVNAATGEVQGDRPYSWVKITFAVLLGLAAALGIFAAVNA